MRSAINGATNEAKRGEETPATYPCVAPVTHSPSSRCTARGYYTARRFGCHGLHPQVSGNRKQRQSPFICLPSLLARTQTKAQNPAVHPHELRGSQALSRRRPTLPPSCPGSTMGAGGLNFRVRNGNGCGPTAIATGKIKMSDSGGPEGPPTANTLTDV